MRIILIFIVLLQTCTYLSCANSKQNNNSEWISMNYPDSIYLSDFLSSFPYYRIDKKHLNDSSICNFIINTKCDTFFIKSEAIRHSDVDVSDPLVAWGKDRFAYSYEWWDVPYRREKQFVNKDSVRLFIMNTHNEFFKLVQSWDTIKMRSLEIPIPCTAHYRSDLFRVLFKNGKFKIDKFEFKDLRLPHLDSEGNSNYDITSTVLIQN